MPTQLKKDWVPDEEYFWGNNANKHQMTDYGESRSWCEHQLPDFKMYFCKSLGGCGKSKANWNLTLWNWVKRNWQNVDKSRLYRKPEIPLQPIKTLGKVNVRITSVEKLEPPPITQNLSGQEIADMLNEIKL